jgi:hypothetical protein
MQPTERGANLVQEAKGLRHGAASLTLLVESQTNDMSAYVYRTRYEKVTGVRSKIPDLRRTVSA